MEVVYVWLDVSSSWFITKLCEKVAQMCMVLILAMSSFSQPVSLFVFYYNYIIHEIQTNG